MLFEWERAAESVSTSEMPHVAFGYGQENMKAEKEEIKFARQAEHLAQYRAKQENEETGSTQAVEAKFITPLDPVIETADGGRLPAIPVEEALKLNKLKEKAEGREVQSPSTNGARAETDTESHGGSVTSPEKEQKDETDAPLRDAMPPSR